MKVTYVNKKAKVVLLHTQHQPLGQVAELVTFQTL
jgi:hypothetical protein